MLMSARMKRIQVLVLNEYAEDVLRELSAVGKIHMIDVKRVLKEHKLTDGRGERLTDMCSDLKRRLYHLMDILDIPKFSEDIEKVFIRRKTSKQYMDDVENEIIKLEEDVLKSSNTLGQLLEESTSLESKAAKLKSMAELGIKVSWLVDSKFVHTTCGFLNADDLDSLYAVLEKKIKKGYVLASGVQVDGKIPTAISVLNETADDLNYALSSVKYDRFTFNGDDQMPDSVNGIEDRLQSIVAEVKVHEQILRQLKETHQKNILVMGEVVEVEKHIANGLSLMGRTRRVHAIEGWVPEKEVKNVIKKIEDVSEGFMLVKLTDPAPDDNIPVALDNPKLIKPFEAITRTFGLPLYNEIDPTPFLAFSFPLIFGMMFGDVGHGTVIALAGYFMIRKKNMDSSFGKILIACGFTSVFFGFLYGSVFGREDILHPYWISIIHYVKAGHTKELFGFALFIGVLHMGLGIIINAVNKARSNGALNTIFGSLSQLVMFVAIATLITKFFDFPIPFIIELAEYPIPLIVLFGVFFPTLVIVAEETLHEYKLTSSIKAALGAAGNGAFEVMESLIMFLSNIISYSRILILALIHGMISEVIFVIGDLVGEVPFIGLILYYLLVIGGTVVLILALEGLVVYIHTIRLHFYEWFTKFYKGGGLEYVPFKITREYTYVKDI